MRYIPIAWMLIIMMACKPPLPPPAYSMTDAQLKNLMFDVQVSEAMLSAFVAEQRDSLRQAFWKKMEIVYGMTRQELSAEVRKLESDPKKMKEILEQVKVMGDSIQ